MKEMFKKKNIYTLFLIAIFLISFPIDSYAQDTPSVLFKTFGQSTSGTINFDNVQLDSIAVNNAKATIANSGELTVYKDDAVRIGGRANPGTHITVMFGDREIQATADYGGDWFVLFSITNMVEGKYVVNAKADNTQQPTFLVNLIVGQGNRILEPSSNIEQSEEETSSTGILVYIGVGIASVILGWFLRTFYEKFSHKRRNNQK